MFKNIKKKINPPKIDIVSVVKTALCIVAFLGAMVFFSLVCADIANNYFILLKPSMDTTVPWLIRFGVSICIFMVMAGVVAVLVRPIWVGMITYLLASILFALILGGGMAQWITAIVLFVLLDLGYLLFIYLQLKNQINFSSHPLGDAKLILCFLLTVLVSVSVGLGYSKDSVKRSYVIPPEFKTYIENQVMALGGQVFDQQLATSIKKQVEDSLKKTKDSIENSFNDVEKNIKPYTNYIALVFGFIAFLIFQVPVLLVGLVASLLFKPFFWLLKITHFANTRIETCEIKHLTL